jgi:hypothetical protein
MIISCERCNFGLPIGTQASLNSFIGPCENGHKFSGRNSNSSFSYHDITANYIFISVAPPSPNPGL